MSTPLSDYPLSQQSARPDAQGNRGMLSVVAAALSVLASLLFITAAVSARWLADRDAVGVPAGGEIPGWLWALCASGVAVTFASAWAFARQTRRFRAHEAIWRAERERLLDAQQLANCGSWESDLDGRIGNVTPAYLDIHGVTEETRPKSSEEWIARFLRDPADIIAAGAALAKSRAGAATEGMRHITLDDGTRKWIHFKRRPKFDRSGRQTGFYGIVRDVTVEQQNLGMLVERTAELEKAKRLAGFGSWSWNVESDRLSTSEQMKTLYGTSDANHPLTLREWSRRFIPPDDLEEYWPLYEARFHGAPFDRERRIIAADGSEKWIRSVAEPVFGPDGRLLRYDGISIDITAQKALVHELAQKTGQLHQAQQIARMGSWYWHIADDRLEVTSQHRELYDLSEAYPVTTMSEWIASFCHPQERDEALASREKILRGESIDVHRRVVTATGRARWLHVIGHPVRDARGMVTGCTGVSHDISAEKEKELALVERTRQLSEANRIARLGHFYWDMASDALELHGDMRAICGDLEPVRFATLHEWEEKCCHPDDRPAVRANRAGNIAAGKPFRTQRRALTASGDILWIEIIAEPVRDAAGNNIAYRGVFRNITAQKVAELKLRQSEEQFRLISENMHDQVALYAADGTILYLSPSTTNLLGYRSADSVGKSPYDNVHPLDVGMVRSSIAALAAPGGARQATLEYRFRHRAGHYVWLESMIVAVRDGDDTVRHFQASTRDVTQRRLAEELLRRSEERFRVLTEISSDWYWETDAQHRFSFFSMEHTFHSRVERDKILGRTRWELFPDALPADQWRDHRETLEAHRPFQGLVIRDSGRDGRIVAYSSVSGRPMFDSDGQFLGYRGTGKDITKMKQAEQQLAESEELYRLIAQNMRDVISLHARNGRITFLSPSFASLTGHSVTASIGIAPRHLLHPDDARQVVRAFARLAPAQKGASTLTYRLRHRQGHYLWLESHVTAVRDTSGEVRHIQVVSRDITARRQAELALAEGSAELARANKRLGEEVRQRQQLERDILMTIEMELAQVGLELHDELGQDLTGISLLAKTLERRLAGKTPEDAAEAARISSLVNRTIGHTRMISHGLSPYIWGMDGLVAALGQLASDINSLGVVHCATRVQGQIHIHDDMVARSLYRIAQESVNNALKHSRARQITLRLSQLADGVELIVTDDGVGHANVETQLEAGTRFHSIRHRCSAIDAALTIKRGRRGGTSVCVAWRPTRNHVPTTTTTRPEQELQ